MSSLTLPNLARWQGRQWAIALSLLLTVTLTPLAWIQWQQYRALDAAASFQVDSIMWQAYQLEREMGRLEHALMDALKSPESADPYGLQERYDVYASRIGLLTKMPRRDLLDRSFEYTATMEALKAFNAIADPLFADPQNLMSHADQLVQLDRMMEDAKPLLGELTREANRAVARFVDERNQQLRQQGILVIGLAAVQIVVMLAFVGLLIQHIRRQQRQYAQLRTLSDQLTVARDQAEAASDSGLTPLASSSATRKASSSDCEALRRGSQAVW